MDGLEILGFVAGCLTTASTVPQLLKTWKKKDASDISVGMFLVLIAGVSLWAVYGVLKSDYPIIVTNAAAVLLNALMLYFKYRFG
jgi:MtN3 and saliva related transmembrane protein